MIKRISIFILCTFCYLLLADTIIAEIGHYQIFESELQQKLQSLSVKTNNARQKALEKLLEEKTLLIYGEEQGITVSDDEVEQFFISQLGTDARFQTNGQFDYTKFELQKNTPKIQRILNLMRQELRLNKIKTIIMSQFNLTDEKLLQQFIQEKASIDIGYAIIKKELADVPPSCTPQKALQFYNKNSQKFMSGYRRKVRFFIISYDAIQDSVHVTQQDIAKAYLKLQIDSPIMEVQDSLATIITEQKVKEKALKIAQKNKEKWKTTPFLDIPSFESPYLAFQDDFGELAQSKDIISTIFNMDKGEVSKPIDIGFGYLVYKLQEIQNPQININEENGELIWKEYVNYEKNHSFQGEYKAFYESNIDSLVTSVAIVSRIILPREDAKNIAIQKQINNLIHDQKKLKNFARKQNFQYSRERIFLHKFSNSDQFNTRIANNIKMNNAISEAVVYTEDKAVFYSIHSIFPSYLPSYDEIQSEMYKVVRRINKNSDITAEDLAAFYKEKKSLFRSKNKIELGGVFVPITPDSMYIPATVVQQYYDKNKSRFYKDEAYKFSYIALQDENKTMKNLVHNAAYWIDLSNWKVLQYCYGKKGDFPQNKWIPTAQLPASFLSFLNSRKTISAPIYHKQTWYILKKEAYRPQGLLSLEDAYTIIEQQKKLSLAKNMAHDYAKSVFDSVRYFSQCRVYADSSMCFKLSAQSFDKPFPLLGDLKEMEKDLMRMYKYEKLSRILELDSGYAILFVLNKDAEKQITYDEIKDNLRTYYNNFQSDNYIKDFIAYLGTQIQDNIAPQEIFRFFGGWNEQKNVTLASELPGIDFSKIIIEDALSKKEGDISHPISLDENHFLIYRLDRKTLIKMDSFEKNKHLFRSKLRTKLFQAWIEKSQLKYKIKLY